MNKCPICDCIVTKRNSIHCSRSCFSKSVSLKNKAKLKQRCLVCRQLMAKSERNCCSRLCSQQLHWTKVAEKVEQGLIHDRTILRRLLFYTEGIKCSICLLTEWTGKPIPLILDHIDGNSEDSSRKNIRLVCPNCDAFLPTYMGRNRGKGRAYRRQLYKEGKHYR